MNGTEQEIEELQRAINLLKCGLNYEKIEEIKFEIRASLNYLDGFKLKVID